MKIVLMMAMTADGKIARHSGHLADWTSPEDKKRFVAESKEHGVIIMGENTFRTFKRPLPGRLNVVLSMEDDPAPIEGVMWYKGEPEVLIEKLETMGYQSALLGGGASINSLFLSHGLIDELAITVEPKLFGTGLSIFAQEAEADLELISLEKINENSFAIRYRVKHE